MRHKGEVAIAVIGADSENVGRGLGTPVRALMATAACRRHPRPRPWPCPCPCLSSPSASAQLRTRTEWRSAGPSALRFIEARSAPRVASSPASSWRYRPPTAWAVAAWPHAQRRLPIWPPVPQHQQRLPPGGDDDDGADISAVFFRISVRECVPRCSVLGSVVLELAMLVGLGKRPKNFWATLGYRTGAPSSDWSIRSVDRRSTRYGGSFDAVGNFCKKKFFLEIFENLSLFS